MKKPDPFQCAVLDPMADGETGLAVAAARAGGVGILDLERFQTPEAMDVVVPRFLRASQLLGDTSRLGWRCGLAMGRPSHDLERIWEGLEKTPGYIIFTLTDQIPEPAVLRPFEVCSRVILEVGGMEELVAAKEAGHQPRAWLLRGNEAGGVAGEDAIFIFLQKALRHEEETFWVRGGIGVLGAASCRLAGAEGVVLDDQVLAMPESGLRKWLPDRVTGQETILLGERCGTAYRLLNRPEFPLARKLAEQAAHLESEELPDEERHNRWREILDQLPLWNEPGSSVWPVGQCIGMARDLAREYRTTGRLVGSILRESDKRIDHARMADAWREYSPLARSHQTRYPCVQGPMTRVSDTAEFAYQVAANGGLPLLALAMMKGEEADRLLEEAVTRLDGKSWGVGILGFIDPTLRARQMEAVLRHRPPFMLIAGGRPDQAAEAEQLGIPAYLHVPTPGLLSLFLKQGARRFVFEGRECGGHVGPLGSAVLWEQAVQTLLKELPAGQEENTHVLFAGGVHDALSAAMTAVLAAPLVERGIKVGVLMGTAYIFTEEAVSSGAIRPGFQEAALACQRTVNLESGLGHANRCALSPFTEEFYRQRRKLLREGKSADEIREELDRLGLGRLRMATKGLERGEDGRLVELDEEGQKQRGMFMIGEAATLHEQRWTLAELHAQISRRSARILKRRSHATVELGDELFPPSPSDVAVIGMATFLPGAREPAQFWQNLLALKKAITEIPEDQFDWRLLYDPDKKATDRAYSKWGGFIGNVEFNPLLYGIPPKVLKSISTQQLFCLEVARRALLDAGLGEGHFDRENTEVIVANADMGGLLNHMLTTRSILPLLNPGRDSGVEDRLAAWTPESLPGVLNNVAAGRVANRFDLGGMNITVDAACAASLAAVDIAVRDLETRRCHLALAGGVDLANTPYGFVSFSKTQALSPTGEARVFDQSADGIVLGEGVGFLVLKRLADAERDGDTIYSVIKSVAGSSDGRGLGMTAPKPQGQMRALRRAYRKAGFSPAEIDYYEAHGTGTVVGDRAEVETVITLLKESDARPHGCTIGSCKSLVGHTKTAAGITSLIKTSLALYHRTLPGHAGVEKPLNPLVEAGAPVALLSAAKPWFHRPYRPRRCGVSAFGFGGANFHAVLEEYRGRMEEPPPGSPQWPVELFVFKGSDPADVRQDLTHLAEQLKQGASPRLADLAFTCWERGRSVENPEWVVAFTAVDLEELQQKLNHALQSDQKAEGIFSGKPRSTEDLQPAFLFPGQGSQYPGMLGEATVYLNPLRESLDRANHLLVETYPQLLTEYLFPPRAFSENARQRFSEALTDSHVAQPAIGAVGSGLLKLLQQLGVQPHRTAGHSYGEITALHAAGSMSFDQLMRFSELRGRLMSRVDGEQGSMAAIMASEKEVRDRLAHLEGVILANINTPRQVVISGSRQAVGHAVELLKKEGFQAVPLAVAGAFHSPLMTPAAEPLAHAISSLELNSGRIPVYSNLDGEPAPANVDELRSHMSDHLLRPVRFMDQIHAMHRDGTRLFIEVGANRVLSRMVSEILDDPAVEVFAMDPDRGSLSGLLRTVAGLAVRLDGINAGALFAGRALQKLDWDALAETTRPVAPAPGSWRINGIQAWTEEEPNLGKSPLLNQETRQTAATEIADSSNPSLPPAMPAVPSTNGDPRVAAFAAYQETMRQFLRTQEQIVRSLCDSMPADSLPQLPTLPDTSVPATQQPSAPQPPAPPAPEPAPAASHPPATGIDWADREQVTALLTRLVSEETGYPVDMLGLNQEIEGELGIDSIKRVEILNQLREKIPTPMATVLEGKMEELSRSKTLNGIIEQLLEAAGETGGPADPTPADQSVEPSSAADSEPLDQLLLRIVSNATGYPTDMLEFHADMESELGIDSIKRVEILEALHDALPVKPRKRMEQMMESLSRLKTLGAVVEALQEDGPAPATSAPTGSLPRPEAAQPDSEQEPFETCARYVIRAMEEPVPAIPESKLHGLYLITRDELGVAEKLATALEARGGTPLIVEPKDLHAAADNNRPWTAQMEKAGGLGGILHLAGLHQRPFPGSLKEWREAADWEVKTLFRLVRDNYPELVAEDGGTLKRILSASLLGGCFGRNTPSKQGSPLAGANVGFLKTLELEAPLLLVKAVDLDPELEPAALADILEQEFLLPGGKCEVGYPMGQRTVFAVEPEPLREEAGRERLELESDWVVLATGGARGITAEILERMARPGMTLHVVGRAPAPEEEPAETRRITEPGDLRRYLVDLARREGNLHSPAEIEKRLHTLLAERQRRHSLQRLRDLGAQVHYHSADVRSEKEFGALLDQLQAERPIDAVLHGAGRIDDRWIREKEDDSFDAVFDTKADSLYLLAERLRQPKLVLLFGSTAGRFGNPGQGDYAAANELVNRMAWRIAARHPTAAVCCINWGPWASTGMASEGVNRLFRERGIQPIATAAGCRFALEEIFHGDNAHLEVVAGEGSWSHQSRQAFDVLFDLNSLLVPGL